MVAQPRSDHRPFISPCHHVAVLLMEDARGTADLGTHPGMFRQLRRPGFKALVARRRDLGRNIRPTGREPSIHGGCAQRGLAPAPRGILALAE